MGKSKIEKTALLKNQKTRKRERLVLTKTHPTEISMEARERAAFGKGR